MARRMNENTQKRSQALTRAKGTALQRRRPRVAKTRRRIGGSEGAPRSANVGLRSEGHCFASANHLHVGPRPELRSPSSLRRVPIHGGAVAKVIGIVFFLAQTKMSWRSLLTSQYSR